MYEQERSRSRTNPVSPSVNLGALEYWYGSDYYPTLPVRLISTTSYNSGTKQGAWETSEVCYDELHPGPPYLTGGPFSLGRINNPDASVVKRDGIFVSRNWNTYSKTQSARYKYEGGFCCLSTGGAYDSAFNVPSTPTNANSIAAEASNYAASMGAAGWNRFQPGRPEAGLGQFLIELRDVPRMLQNSAKHFSNLYRTLKSPSMMASEWLNYSFGWKPFLRDLRKFASLSQNLNTSLKRLKENNGKWRKAGGIMDESSVTETIAKGSGTKHYPGLWTQMWHPGSPNLSGGYSVERATKQKAWFEASFRYWIPDIQDLNWNKRAIAHLYGLEVTPSLIWEVTPWSWLIDWFTNVGDVISNMSTLDNLVAKYAYAMGTKESSIDISSWINYWAGPIADTWSFHRTGKARVEANPFGFSYDWTALSPSQWSILIALGLTKGIKPLGSES